MGLFDTLFKTRITEGGKALVQTGGPSSSGVITSEEDETWDSRVERYKMYKRAYEKVPIVRAIIDTKADQTVQDFYFDGPNEKKLEKLRDKLNFPLYLHQIDLLRRLYGNAFTEVVGMKELKVLNPIWMKVYRKETGDVTGYGQIIGSKHMTLWGSTGSVSENDKFMKKVGKIDTIIHNKRNTLGDEKYGRSDLEPVMHILQIMLDMEEDLRKVIFKYIAPLIWAKVGNDQFPASQSIIDDISGVLRDLHAESELTTSHTVDLSVLDFKSKGFDIATPLNHVLQQVTTGGKVPPVLLGLESSGGKEAAEVQLRNFGRHIKAGQRELKADFEDKFIQKMGVGTEKDKLIWSHVEEREWEVEVDTIRGLVTDGVITPQKGNDLLPPKYKEKLPEIEPLNQQGVGPDGVQTPRPTQRKDTKDTVNKADTPNDPTKTTKNPNTKGRRVTKTDRQVPIK